ncbi:MAG TPA: Rho termination factor N-terminal domain-containing protein [Micromonosporaceae bacterium]
MKRPEDLKQMKTGEVAKLAKKSGIEGIEFMNKQQMIDAITANGGVRGSAKAGQGGHRRSAPASAGGEPKD